jgi:hypothetical protein
MWGLAARWLTLSGVLPVNAQPWGLPARTTEIGCRIRLRGLRRSYERAADEALAC